jgi:hypothetical protein
MSRLTPCQSCTISIWWCTGLPGASLCMWTVQYSVVQRQYSKEPGSVICIKRPGCMKCPWCLTVKTRIYKFSCSCSCSNEPGGIIQWRCKVCKATWKYPSVLGFPLLWCWCGWWQPDMMVQGRGFCMKSCTGWALDKFPVVYCFVHYGHEHGEWLNY